MESMTGFGSCVQTAAGYEVTVLCRSVNNKGLSLSFRLPRQGVHLEQRLSPMARKLFSRGRIDLNMSIEPLGETALPEPDLDLAGTYVAAAQKLAEEFFLTSSPDAFSLAVLPGVMRQPTPPEGEDFDQLMMSVCEEALRSLLKSRRGEGVVQRDTFREYLARMKEQAATVFSEHSSRVSSIFQQRRKRIEELLGEAVTDENRLAQELAILSDRIDITEEYQRLSAHIDASMEILEDNSCGRKLGFLLQEMHRELNTMGSKADSTKAVHTVVEMKELLGALREQVANVQ